MGVFRPLLPPAAWAVGLWTLACTEPVKVSQVGSTKHDLPDSGSVDARTKPKPEASAGEAGSGDGGSDGGADGGDTGCGPKTAKDPVLPCDVDAVLEARCRRCHQDPPKNHAPFPLMTWENTQVVYFGKTVHERMLKAVSTDYMPFKGIKLNPPVESLDPDQKATLLAWLECGALPADGVECPQ